MPSEPMTPGRRAEIESDCSYWPCRLADDVADAMAEIRRLEAELAEMTAERDKLKAALEEISVAVAEQTNESELDKVAWLAKCLNRLTRIGSIAYKAIKGTDGLPTTAELSGSDPDFTGGMESVQYVRMLRGDPHASASGAEGGQG